jgi:hypothetical protein
MPEDNTQQLNDPLDTKPLIEQLAREMVLTREMLLERFERVDDRLSAIEKEIRLLGRKIDVFGEDLTRARVDVRDLDARVGTLEQKPA